MNRRRWPVRFRVRPATTAMWCWVTVLPTLQAMRAYVSKRGGPPGRYCKAVARCYSVQTRQDGRWRLTREAGELVLAHGWYGMGLLTHECSHLALSIAKRLKLDPVNDQSGRVYLALDGDNERYCYIVGELARCVVGGLERHGLIRRTS